MSPYVSLFIGVACGWLGGEFFVRGLVGLARWAQVSAGVIATTFAAFATSSPEVAGVLGFGLLTKLMIVPRRDALIPRSRGPILLAIYAGFFLAMLRG